MKLIIFICRFSSKVGYCIFLRQNLKLSELNIFRFQIDQICKFSGVQLWFSRATLYMDIQLESRPRSLYWIFLFFKTCPLNSKFERVFYLVRKKIMHFFSFTNSISYGWVFIYWLLFSLFFSSGSIKTADNVSL